MNDIAEIEAIIALIEANPMPEDLPGMRAAFDAAGGDATEGVAVRAVDANGVPCELYTPEGGREDRCIQYFHGGGYVIGSLQSHRPTLTELAKVAGCQVLAVDYRLAPEHPYPAPVEDAQASYQWLLGQGYTPQQLVMAGDSAGGGLVFAALTALRDNDQPLPGAAVGICPWVDMEATGESHRTRAEIDPFISLDMLNMLRDTYLAGSDPSAPLASPLNADLSGLPPTLIQVGSREVLFSDAERAAAKITASGGQVVFEEWPDMIHVWHLYWPMLDAGRRALARIGEFVQQTLPD